MRPCTTAARCGPTSCSTALPGDLVPELQHCPVGDEQPGGDGLVEGSDVGVGHHAEQGGLDPFADQRGRVEHAAAGGREPGDSGEHRVAG